MIENNWESETKQRNKQETFHIKALERWREDGNYQGGLSLWQ